MKLTAKEVAALVQGALSGDETVVITGANGLDDAKADELSFLGNPKYADRLPLTKASVVLVPPGTTAEGKTLIAVKNPQFSFAQVLTLIDRERKAALPKGIHPTAVIAATAVLGKDVSVGPCAVIEDNVTIGEGSRVMAHSFIGSDTKIGAGCLIYPNVTVRERITIGDRVIVHSGTVIGSDGFGFVPTPTGIFKIPQIGSVSLGDDVEIGANVTIDRANTGVTRIGRGTKIDNLVQVAHNVQIGENCMIVAQVGVAGSTKLGNGIVMGGQSGTVGHISIADGVTVAARGGVIADIKEKGVYSGFPARPHREALKVQALTQRLPELYDLLKQLKKKVLGN